MDKQLTVIAIVDDDPGIRGSMAGLLSALGYHAELYASAEEFARAATTTEASCIVIDMQLGEISGVELARQLAAAGFSFPVIFMTGSMEGRHQRDALNFGCTAFLRKPFPAVQLLDAIAKAIGRTPGRDGANAGNGAE